MSYKNKKQTIKLLSYMSTFDGGLYFPSAKKDRPNNKINAMFIMNMAEENRDYLEWVKETLNEFVGAHLEHRPDYNTDGYKRKPQLRLESNRHPLLTKLHSRLYLPNRKKVIDPHMLKLMDAEALAIIFMTDGGSKADKGQYYHITLNTKGFSYADNMALSKAIYSKLGIRTTVSRHYNYYYLRVKNADGDKFVSTVLPYMKESFLYKLERLAPAMGDDIVCSLEQFKESCRNDKTAEATQ